MLARIKGAERRSVARLVGIENVPFEVAAGSLEHADREAAGAFHPALMGGEYLPDLGSNEVEIARFELQSVTFDVISLRARRQSGWQCDRAAAERLVSMVSVSSEFYPELGGYYDMQADEWLADRLGELEREEDQGGAGDEEADY